MPRGAVAAVDGDAAEPRGRVLLRLPSMSAGATLQLAGLFRSVLTDVPAHLAGIGGGLPSPPSSTCTGASSLSSRPP
ncbi:hypothetical protein ACIRVK_28160 [Streptomyces sp. NPDC101152]|uniref:hypothetical protein n=1 Tax=Streptomyces sp. NPDC101152 TaxID=3366116 RepID=UPI0037F16845